MMRVCGSDGYDMIILSGDMVNFCRRIYFVGNDVFNEVIVTDLATFYKQKKARWPPFQIHAMMRSLYIFYPFVGGSRCVIGKRI